MNTSKSLDEKIKIDNNLSNRYIDLDPNGYFIIKVDFEENKIILEHFLNKFPSRFVYSLHLAKD